VLSKVELILLDKETVGNQVLPFLPLTEMSNVAPALPTTPKGEQ
jgi:hypothetical protein